MGIKDIETNFSLENYEEAKKGIEFLLTHKDLQTRSKSFLYAMLGLCHFYLGNKEAAIDAYRNTLSIGNQIKDFFHPLNSSTGTIKFFRLKKELKNAGVEVDQLSEKIDVNQVEKKDYKSIKKRIRTNFSLNNYKKAKEEILFAFEHKLVRNKSKHFLYSTLGLCHFYLGNKEAAIDAYIDAYRSALKIKKKTENFRYLEEELKKADVDVGQLREKVEDRNKAENVEPSSFPKEQPKTNPSDAQDSSRQNYNNPFPQNYYPQPTTLYQMTHQPSYPNYYGINPNYNNYLPYNITNIIYQNCNFVYILPPQNLIPMNPNNNYLQNEYLGSTLNIPNPTVFSGNKTNGGNEKFNQKSCSNSEIEKPVIIINDEQDDTHKHSSSVAVNYTLPPQNLIPMNPNNNYLQNKYSSSTLNTPNPTVFSGNKTNGSNENFNQKSFSNSEIKNPAIMTNDKKDDTCKHSSRVAVNEPCVDKDFNFLNLDLESLFNNGLFAIDAANIFEPKQGNNKIEKKQKRSREEDDSLNNGIKRSKKYPEIKRGSREFFCYLSDTGKTKTHTKLEYNLKKRKDVKRKYNVSVLEISGGIEEKKEIRESPDSFKLKRLTLINMPPLERFRIIWNNRLNEDQKNQIAKIAQTQFQKFKEGELFWNITSSLKKPKTLEEYQCASKAEKNKKFQKALLSYKKILETVIETSIDEQITLHYDIARVHSKQNRHEDAISTLYSAYSLIYEKIKECQESSEKERFNREAIFVLRSIYDTLENLLNKERENLGKKNPIENNLKSDFTLNGISECNNPLEKEYRSVQNFFSKDPHFPKKPEVKLFRPLLRKDSTQNTGQNFEVKSHPHVLYAEIFAETLHTLLTPDQIQTYLDLLTYPEETEGLLPLGFDENSNVLPLGF